MTMLGTARMRSRGSTGARVGVGVVAVVVTMSAGSWPVAAARTPMLGPDPGLTAMPSPMSPSSIEATDASAPAVTRVTLTGFVTRRGQVRPIPVPQAEGTVVNGSQTLSGSGAFGINDAGQIVGSYVAGGTSHGFLLDEREYTTIDVPGAVSTTVADINNRGQMVGAYVDGQGRNHGFVRSHRGRFRILDVPGAAITGPHRINDQGQVVGVFSTPEDRTAPVRTGRGFLWDDGEYTTIVAPGAGPLTDPAAINDHGVVVGAYDDANGATHGFLRTRQGRFVTIDLPGASFTSPVGINNHGTIVGQYVDASGVAHGYRLRHGRLTNVDVPGASFTAATDINDQGHIVGLSYQVA